MIDEIIIDRQKYPKIFQVLNLRIHDQNWAISSKSMILLSVLLKKPVCIKNKNKKIKTIGNFKLYF